ncbi:hypothetical protein ACFZCG_38470 [Streptomyces tanashiensis]|uniref:hypothetical protein n=1 Tax=Streptomyces tanashiensis TaxID=67367 RepID=UPI0036E20F72
MINTIRTEASWWLSMARGRYSPITRRIHDAEALLPKAHASCSVGWRPPALSAPSRPHSSRGPAGWETSPSATTPYVAGKSVPGGTVDRPLTRLYEGGDAAAAPQRQKNITAKSNACAAIRPANPTGLDRDEYPFGSTWEDSAAGTTFSVQYLDLSRNHSARATLGNWDTKDRVLHGEKSFVKIIP